MTLFPAHFRDPYFQSKTLLVLLTLAWIVVGYLAEGLQFSLLAMAPHLAMAAVSFKRHHTVMDVLVFLVGTETAFWLIMLDTRLVEGWRGPRAGGLAAASAQFPRGRGLSPRLRRRCLGHPRAGWGIAGLGRGGFHLPGA